MPNIFVNSARKSLVVYRIYIASPLYQWYLRANSIFMSRYAVMENVNRTVSVVLSDLKHSTLQECI